MKMKKTRIKKTFIGVVLGIILGVMLSEIIKVLNIRAIFLLLGIMLVCILATCMILIDNLEKKLKKAFNQGRYQERHKWRHDGLIHPNCKHMTHRYINKEDL